MISLPLSLNGIGLVLLILAVLLLLKHVFSADVDDKDPTGQGGDGMLKA